ncbi:MAG: hypothetical protein ABSA72_05595 [Nitrososphaerales archaeon]
MLKYEVHQVHLEETGRYYLPLPKLTSLQLVALEERLAGKGFSVERERDLLRAEGGSCRLTVSRSGLAWSEDEVLDALSPAIPLLLRHSREPVKTNPYFASKKMRGGFEVQFFPRMEGLRIWSALRSSGASGLTPDERDVVSQLLAGADQPIECVTDYPAEGCSVLRMGRTQYYRASVPASEFVSRLRTLSTSFPKNCYLPRSSVIRVTSKSLPQVSIGRELGEWCYLEIAPKSL